MEQFVFREFMRNEVIQKTVIFADALGLRITAWHPRNTEKYPYRIDFYSDGLWVGYIDAKVFLGFVESEMPFELYTPFGKTLGTFWQSQGNFDYKLNITTNEKKELNGVFTVRSLQKENTFSSMISLRDENNLAASLRFNAGRGIIEITKYSKQSQEEVIMTRSGIIDHSRYLPIKKKEQLARIILEIEEKICEETRTACAKCEFLHYPVYDKEIMLKEGASSYRAPWNKIGFIKTESLLSEIKLYDERMLDFFNEINGMLTLSANGITPVSIFDRMAKLCFYGQTQQFFYELLRPTDVKISLDHNPVLKKMNDPKK